MNYSRAARRSDPNSEYPQPLVFFNIGWSEWAHGYSVSLDWSRVPKSEWEEGMTVYRHAFAFTFSLMAWRGLRRSLSELFRVRVR